MANSLRTKNHQIINDLIAFNRSSFFISVFATLLLVILAFKDVFYLRFNTSILGESSQYSDGTTRLLIDGFSGNLFRSFSGSLPFIAMVLIVCMVTYSVLSTYKRTYASLNISKNYINAKRSSASNIAVKYIFLRSAAFALPLLYWGYFLTVWFPAIASYPLRYIISPNIVPFILSVSLMLLILLLITHLGIILSRLAVRLFRYV